MGRPGLEPGTCEADFDALPCNSICIHQKRTVPGWVEHALPFLHDRLDLAAAGAELVTEGFTGIGQHFTINMRQQG
jgi:hypothetical protein